MKRGRRKPKWATLDYCEHPSLPVAFVPGQRLVLYWDAGLELYLPHEIIHAVWAGSEDFMGPDAEWSEGMIPYEIAWVEKLTVTPAALECLPAWLAYAREGVPLGEQAACLATAKRVVKKRGLPSPWSRR